jgi:hypothetical protein
MTVSSTSSRVVYNGDGATTAFPFAFKVSTAADLVVIYADATGTDFTLSASQYGATGFGLDGGGTVTYPLSGSPIAIGTLLTIQRVVAATQPTSISNQGAMWPQIIEAALDRITMICQSFIDTAARSLKISPTDAGTLNPLPTSVQRANSVLGFDASGQPYAATLTGSLVAASNWLVANFFPMSSAAAARGALGAIAAGDSTTFTGTNTFPTQGANDNSTKAATTAYADRAAMAAAASVVMRSYLAGLQLSNDSGTPNTKIDVSAGVCVDSTNAAMLLEPAGAIDCTTVGANGLDSGSLAATTSYHAFVIAKAGGATPALLASTSATTPTLPATYTLFRRIGSFRTDGSAHILGFIQDGDYFRLKTSILDVNDTNPGTAAQLKALSVPTGVIVTWFGNLAVQTSTTVSSIYLSDLAATDEAPRAASAGTHAAPDMTMSILTGGLNSQFAQVRTDTSGRIRYRLSNSAGDIIVGLVTLGWFDRRGRDA